MAVAGAWTGARKDRRQTSSWHAKTGDADQLILDDLQMLRDRSGDAYRNNPLATGVLKTNCTAVIGSGLTLQSRIDRDVLNMSDDQADAWESNTERAFNSWANSTECHVGRDLTFGEIQKLAFLSVMLKGDTFVSMPMISRPGSKYKTKVQVIDAERVSNPDNLTDSLDLSAGVEKDQYGAPKAYHICNIHPTRWDAKKEKAWKRFPVFGEKTGRRNILHLYEAIMPEQTRGVPYLAPVIEPLKMLDRYTEAELMAASVSALFTVFITTEAGDANLSPMEPTAETGGKNADKDFKMGAGAMLGLAPGEDIKFADPNRPNTAFDPFVMAVLRQIGVALEMPFELLIKHFTSSYSASRAAILEAWRFFTARRRWMAMRLCLPVYATWMEEAVAMGNISAPGFFDDPIIRQAYLGAMWNGPARGHIDEQKEINAAEKRIGLGISTHAQETAEINGGDWDKNARRLKKEFALKRESGMPEIKGAEVNPNNLNQRDDNEVD